MDLDITQMSEDQLRTLRQEINARRTSAPTRRAVVKRQQKVDKAVSTGKLLDLESLL